MTSSELGRLLGSETTMPKKSSGDKVEKSISENSFDRIKTSIAGNYDAFPEAESVRCVMDCFGSNKDLEHDFEDNKTEPSPDMEYLKGRCLDGLQYSGQLFTAEWIFQRALNICVHKLRKLQWQTQEREGWYSVHVDGTVLEQRFPGGIVVLMACVLSPLTFPVIFGFATLALLFPGTWCWLGTYTKKKRTSDEHGRAVYMPTDESCFSYWQILKTLFCCVWYFACSALPWAVILTHSFTKDGSGIHCMLNPKCDNVRIHVSHLTAASPWLACALAAFRWTHEIHTSACDCACEASNRVLLEWDKDHTRALEAITTKLACKQDKMSFWPIFVKSENEEPDAEFSFLAELTCIILPLLHGLLPQLFMMLEFGDQGVLPQLYHIPQLVMQEAHSHPLELSLICVGILAPVAQIRDFLRKFYDAILEYEDVAKQLIIFSCMTSTYMRRKTDETRRLFMKVVIDNDMNRYQNFAKRDSVHFCGSVSERFPDKERRQQFTQHIDELKEEWARKTSSDDKQLPEQLDDLWMYQVAFNMHSREGIALYRKVRTWLITDTLNEGLEIEWYITFSVQISVAALLGLAFGFFDQHCFTAAWTVLPFDIIALTYLIIRGLNSCVAANHFLFDQSCQSLLDWMDTIGIQDARFHDDQAAWILEVGDANSTSGDENSKPKGLLKLKEDPDDTPDSRNEVRNVLDSTIRRIDRLETPQQILGISITRSFRNRIAAALLSAILASASSVIKALLDEDARSKLVLTVHDSSLLKAMNSSIFT